MQTDSERVVISYTRCARMNQDLVARLDDTTTYSIQRSLKALAWPVLYSLPERMRH